MIEKCTPQQQEAMELIRAFIESGDGQIFILKGYAGTGKTTLVGCIVEWLRLRGTVPQVMAPTGRAAKVLNTKIKDCDATTIHRRIYDFAGVQYNEKDSVLKFSFPIMTVGCKGVYIIDEASMISSKKQEHEIYRFGTNVLISDLLTYARPLFGGKIIFVGDPAQLPPVGDIRSAALDEAYFSEKSLKVSSYTLTDVIRQSKESLILSNATKLRDMLMTNERNTFVIDKKEGEVTDIDSHKVAEEYCRNGDSKAAIVCFSNRQVAQYNKAVRSILFPNREDLVAGDKLMIVRNNYYMDRMLMNGEIITVTEVSDTLERQSAPVYTEEGRNKERKIVELLFRRIKFETADGEEYCQYIIDSLLKSPSSGLNIDEMKALYINLKMRVDHQAKGMNFEAGRELFRRASVEDPYYNALHVKYGYAFTCHKAQGGEWDTVYVDFQGRNGLNDDCLRWKYTAVTRAKQRLLCINLNDITPLFALRFTAIVKAKKANREALSFDKDVEETPFHSADAQLAQKWKYWSVFWNMVEDGGRYAILKVTSLPWRERYEVKTPNDGRVTVDAIYNSSYLFSSYEGMGEDDTALRAIFENDINIKYDISYKTPKFDSLRRLHAGMVSLCDELDITLTNVVEHDWHLAYYMKTSARYASIEFYFDKDGFINYGKPLSSMGDDDSKLVTLIERMK